MNHYLPKVGETTAEECQRKWRSVRDRFVRETKKVKERKSGDPSPPYTPVWELNGMLTFLKDQIKHQTQKVSLMNCVNG